MRLSIVIPSYRRGAIVVDTVRALAQVLDPADEILVVDQTADHPVEVGLALGSLERDGFIRWIRLSHASIPIAMNHGLRSASGEVVLFLDDDIVPDNLLVRCHREAHTSCSLIAGQVLQPGQQILPLAPDEPFRFNSASPAWIEEFMGGNFSVSRERALRLGGFDENFVGAAYRFEADFAHRYVKEFGPIRYEPHARIYHLAISSGGTRAHGHHLRTINPSHAVGAYYFLLKSRRPGWIRELLWRPIRAVRTRHHLRRPWWIPITMIAEARGFILARRLLRAGPKLIEAGTAPLSTES
jgi:glycosyltransferase involved in cell wall biosynthesis